MSIFIINKIYTERDRCKMANATLKGKQSLQSKKARRICTAQPPKSRNIIQQHEKPRYLVVNRGGNICLYNFSTKTTEFLNARSAEKIPPGAKITIKQDGMSRVQVASIIDLIYGSNGSKSIG